MALYGSESSIPNYYNDAPDRPLFGESRPRVSTCFMYYVRLCFYHLGLVAVCGK